MVAYQFKFAKVLTIREQEKSETEMAFKESVSSFEKVATELYNLLKKKENTTDTQNNLLLSGLSVDNIHHYSNYMDGLQKELMLFKRKLSKQGLK